MSNTTNQPTNVLANPTTPTQENTMKKQEKTKANMDTLTMGAHEFNEYAQEKGEVALARGESYKKAVMSAGWELRLALGSKRRDIENLMALNYVKALSPMQDNKNATPAQVMEVQQKMFAELPTYADVIEKLYAQYNEHSYIIATKTEWEFELHPFTRQISFAQQADAQEASQETISLEELNKEFTLDDLDGDEYSAEYEEAFSAWGANSEISQVMNQSDKKKHKEHNQINEARTASGDINARVKPTYENIDREGWIEDNMAREFDEWADSANWGAFAANLMIVQKAFKMYPSLREQLTEQKREIEVTPKTISGIVNRLRTQEIVLSVAADRAIEYIHRLEIQQHDVNKMVHMPPNERLEEVITNHRNIEDAMSLLSMINPKLRANEEMMIRDVEKYGESKSLSLWRTFNLWDDVMTALSKTDKILLAKVGTSAHFNPDEMTEEEAKERALYIEQVKAGITPTVAKPRKLSGLQFWSIDLNFQAPRDFQARVVAAVGQASLRNYHTESGKAGKLAAEKYLANLARTKKSTKEADDLIANLLG